MQQMQRMQRKDNDFKRLERSKNDSFEWQTKVFKIKIEKFNLFSSFFSSISRIWTGRSSRYIRPPVVYVTLWSKFSL